MVYLGSKSKIIKFISPLIQNCINDNHIETYIEPFVGGGNVIEKISCNKRIGADINEYLIELLKFAQSHKYDDFPKSITYDEYCSVKECYLNHSSKYEKYYIGLVGFLASYNGKFFNGGYSKQVTVNGKIRNYYLEHLKNLMSQILSGIDFIVSDYRNFSNYSDCLFYCDPPYRDTTAYSVEFDSDEFFDFARKLSKNNIVLISEQSAPEDFECIWKIQVKRHVSAFSKFEVYEKLFIYKHGKNINIPIKRSLF